MRHPVAKNIPAKIEFLEGEINGLRARMVSIDNGAQRVKLEMLQDMLADYTASKERALAKRDAA